MVTTEQLRHDEINLSRLLRRLEKSVADTNWDAPENHNSIRDSPWMKSEETLQKVKFAKKLLRNVESSNGPSQKTQTIRASLDRMDGFLQLVKKKSIPRTRRPEPILPTLPLPSLPVEPPSETQTEETKPPEDADTAASPTDDNLLDLAPDPLLPIAPASESGPNLVSNMPSLIPSSTSSGASKSTAILMQNSHALQQEMTDQLAQMSAQLRRNMIHFSESLAKDAAVVEETSQKLESNFDAMSANQTQLKVHQGKSWSTTWLTMFVVVSVLVLFASMVFLIRFT
ncbi:hypothetical protein V5O48_015936 [Marasmius crinis-equi]|uniref:Uncharacterized protein n=1 Tax=Marasmius crinis-equi TaxID=585013 RepID=A0ABR3ET65_9AGAR